MTPSRLSIILIASLAANAVLFGIVIGRVLSSPQPHEPTMQMQLERYGPTSDVVNSAWAQLPEGDRVKLRIQLQEIWFAMEAERRYLSDAGQRVYDAALTEPFDEIKLRDAVAIFQLRENRLQQAAEDILISHLGGMPAVARATAAAGLLTPFNARVKDFDGGDKPAEGEGEGNLPVVIPPPGVPGGERPCPN